MPHEKAARPDSFLPDLLRLAVPIALSNLVVSGVNMLDTVMVGRLGQVEIAAVALGNQVYFLFMLLLFGISSGAGIFTAQYWGARDLPGVRRTAGFSIALGLGASLLYMAAAMAFPRLILGLYSPDPAVVELGSRYLRVAAASYPPTALSFALGLSLRGTERVRLPLASTIVGFGSNLVLNWALIFGKLGAPALGVEGAAIATVAARWIEATVLAVGAWARRMPPAGTPRELFSWNRAWVARFLMVAFPVILNEVAWSLGITFYNGIFARVGTGAVASFNIVNTINQLGMVLFFGTANASAVMLGKAIGEGDLPRARDWAKRFADLGVALGAVAGSLLAASGFLVPLLFKVDEATVAGAKAMLLALGVAFPFKVFNLHLVVGICRSGGDTRFGMLFDLLGVWGIGVPLAALGAFAWKLPAWAVFALLNVEEFAKFFAGRRRLRSGRWARDVRG